MISPKRKKLSQNVSKKNMFINTLIRSGQLFEEEQGVVNPPGLPIFYPFIDIRNSSLLSVKRILSFRNSMASNGFISAR